MRDMTSGAIAKIANRTGNEPVNIVAINWHGNTFTEYADKDLDNIPGKILELGSLDEIMNLQQSTTSATISVKLDDRDAVSRP